MMMTSGVVCVLIAQEMSLSNNIVFENQIGNGRAQTGGPNCSWTYSDIGSEAEGGIIPGSGNINRDPTFANPLQNDFHLQPSSPAKDAADPAATLIDDFDGDARPQGSMRDMGADEIRQ
jgi:hypothetical protein